MEQTFNDLCREREESEQGLFCFAGWIFCETFAAILRENVTVIGMQYKNLIRIVLATACILSLPLLAMQFTDEVNWGVADFVLAAILLIGSGFTYELLVWKSRTIANRAAVAPVALDTKLTVARDSGVMAYRIGAGLAIATGFILVWMNLAVGLIGSEDNPANLLYGGVLAIGIVGALLAKFEPSGMARTLFLTALAQALVPVIALIIWRPPMTPGVLGVFVLNGFFVVLFVGSALLFRRASHESVNSVL